MSYQRIFLIAAIFASTLAGMRAGTSLGFQTPQMRLKLGTSAPVGTAPYKELQLMGEKGRKAPAGGVDLIITNTQGGEAATVGRMRVGQLQAAMLSVTGLSEIDPSVRALEDIPFIYRSLDEAEYVRRKLTPDIQKKFLEKGYVVLFWSDVGWVRFFSNEAMIHPADLKRMKVFTWAGDHNQTDIMKAAGFNPVPLETEYILTSLQTGQINVVPTPPLIASAGQFYGKTKHMLEINYAPLVGGTVITKKAWDSIPADAQEAIQKAADDAGESIKQKSRLESEQAVKSMQDKWGLIVHRTTPEIDAEWQQVAKSISPKIRGGIVPAELYDRVLTLLDEFRAAKPQPSAAAAAK
jgi:TRAP-type C4-dicarboxylate transport system substrate-binding protein